MGNPLRDRSPLAELTAKGQVFEIASKVGDFSELARIVKADLDSLDADRIPRGWRDEPLTGRLAFGFADAQGRVPTIDGELAVTLDAVCQRCLTAFRMPLSVTMQLLPVVANGSEIGKADSGNDEYEVWELDDEMVCPADIVEEALIMAMPFAAMHAEAGECENFEPAADGAEQTTRPFAGLKAQLEEKR